MNWMKKGAAVGRLGAALIVLVVTLVGCVHEDGTALVKSSPGYPCGVVGVPCANGACCPQGHTCGGAFPAVGCPEGQCCAVGDELLARRTAKTMIPQTPAVSR